MFKKINLSTPVRFSAHRSGWGYAIDNLLKYHDNKGILLDDFIDITFGYNFQKNLEQKIIPYKKPWIGFLHHPPRICPWYERSYKSSIDIHFILNSEPFLRSLQYCEGIFVLSEYLKKYILENFAQFKKIPIFVLKHPTEFGLYSWDFYKFKKFYKSSGIKLISIGYFLRNLSSLFLVSSNKKLDKILLPSHIEMALANLEKEIKYKKLIIDKNKVKILAWQDNLFYDKILEQSVSFLDLYDTSCNNAIIECLVRNTPMIINEHPAVTEYVGKNYPLYFNNISDVGNLLTYDSIQTAAEFLQSQSKKELTGEYFCSEFQKYLSKLNVTTKPIRSKKLVIKKSHFDHRYGWPWVIGSLQKNNKFNKGNNFYLNDFLEHTFRKEENKTTIINNRKYGLVRGYNLFSHNKSDICCLQNRYYEWKNNRWAQYNPNKKTLLSLDCNKIETYKTNSWMGFLHNPVKMPKWFDYDQNINSLLNNKDFIESLHNCKAIFVLSLSLKQDLIKLFSTYGIKKKIIALKHPIPSVHKHRLWKEDLFLENKNIIQIGYWLRNMHSFWQLETDLCKTWLYGDKFAADMLVKENLVKNNQNILSSRDAHAIHKSIQEGNNITINNVYIAKTNTSIYDKLLRSSLGFVNFYDCAASNAVVECIATSTPLLVNKLPSVVEYLGKNYPLYFSSIKQASRLSMDKTRIRETHEYLHSNSHLRDKLNINNFISSFYSEYKNICKK